MSVAALRKSPLGSLIPVVGTDGRTGEHYETWGFLPADLPESVALSTATWAKVVEAERDLARLDQAARQLPDPTLLHQPSLRREAQSTSALEGTFAPFETVLESSLEERGELSQEVREILNYVVAAEEAFDWIAERPLTVPFVTGLQRTLVRGTPSEHEDAGRLRDRQVMIGPKGAPITAATFVPVPPGDQLRAGFESWIDRVNRPPEDMPAVVQAALAHYQFETLHPFSDGNGRIGRMLVVLQLVRLGALRDPILVVSPWFEARREEYQRGLQSLSESGDWDAWVRFFATGIGASAETTRQRVDDLFAWRGQTLTQLAEQRVIGLARQIADTLIGTPALSATNVVELHEVSHQGAMNALRRLAQLGVLEERRRGGRLVFVAPDVVELLAR